MLTQSPVAASTPNVSPRTGLPAFHYASAPSPRNSPSRVSAALPRPPSTASPLGSVTSSSAQRPPYRYVGVDAATQYSPMEPVDYRTGAALPRLPQEAAGQSLRPVPIEGPSLVGLDSKPARTPKQPPSQIETASSARTLSKQVGQPARPGGGMQSSSSSQPVSPPKRRNSQITSSIASAPSIQGLENLAKRPKPDSAPAKILPRRYEFCAAEDMVVLIAHMLGELIETNDPLALKSGHLTRFHSRTAPGISVLDYLHRLAKHATLTPPLLLSMVYYIDRLCALYPEFTINTLTVHRFLITAATVAAKGLSDAFWNNSTYARVGGVRVAELKMLELEFLYRVDWRIVPNPEVLVSYYRGLVERCPGYEIQDGPSITAGEDGGDDEASDEIDDGDEADATEEQGEKSSDGSSQARSVSAGQPDIPQSSNG